MNAAEQPGTWLLLSQWHAAKAESERNLEVRELMKQIAGGATLSDISGPRTKTGSASLASVTNTIGCPKSFGGRGALTCPLAQ
jgi:hypothetical protein